MCCRFCRTAQRKRSLQGCSQHSSISARFFWVWNNRPFAGFSWNEHDIHNMHVLKQDGCGYFTGHGIITWVTLLIYCRGCRGDERDAVLSENIYVFFKALKVRFMEQTDLYPPNNLILVNFLRCNFCPKSFLAKQPSINNIHAAPREVICLFCPVTTGLVRSDDPSPPFCKLR